MWISREARDDERKWKNVTPDFGYGSGFIALFVVLVLCTTCSSDSMTSPSGLVVVTGASGFLGSEVVLAFLEAGFHVRGTVRQQQQAKAFLERYPKHAKQLDFMVVPDMKAPNAFQDAVKGATYVVHTASPALAAVDADIKSIEQELLLPNINAVKSLMEAVSNEPGVKAVVITSSFTTCRDYTKPEDPDRVYTSADWGPLTYEQAASFPISKDARTMMAPNGAAKGFAEKTAWDYIAAHPDAGFTLTTILPTWITGPSKEAGLFKLSDLRNNTSSKIWEEIVDKPSIAHCRLLTKYVDVRDVAVSHVQAILKPETQGKRYLLLAGSASVEEIAQVTRKLFPRQADRIVPVPADKIFTPEYGADGTPAEKAFGFTYRSLEQTQKDWGDQYFGLEP